MNCKTCGYRLWNLPARRCPECGGAFRPSDFEFVPNSVQFCCPHCEQPYYGTDEKGHLVPRAFDCVACGAPLEMDAMMLRPSEGVAEEKTGDHNAWLMRREIGSIKAWFRMIGRGMIDPVRVMRATPPDAGAGEAWLFAIITLFVIYTVSSIPGVGINLVLSSAMGVQMMSWFDYVSWLIWPVVVIGLIGVWGLVAHGLLLLGGRPAFGMGRTYQALCYSTGPMIFSAVPLLSGCVFWVGWVWWVVSATLMVTEGQRVTGGRAALAVVTPAVLSIVLLIGGMIAIIFLMFSAMPTTMSMGNVNGVNLALTMHQTTNNAYPAHAGELAVNGFVTASDFVDWQTLTTEADVPIGNTTLDQFDLAGSAAQTREAAAAANALPPNVITHRLGDFVFTYHGIDPQNADPGLWLVVMSPDPAINPNWSGNVEVGTFDGGTRTFPTSSLAGELNAQNALRAQYNLPPLPDPSTVTHAQPAAAP